MVDGGLDPFARRFHRFGPNLSGMRRAVVPAVAVLALAGCSSYEPEETAHRAAIEQVLGHPVVDWPAYLQEIRKHCDGTDTVVAFAATLGSDTERAIFRRSLEYECPDRLDAIREAEADQARVRAVCETIEAERSKEHSKTAEAMGC